MRLLALAFLMTFPSIAHAQGSLNLHLVCGGDGSRSRTQVITGQLSTPGGEYSGVATYDRDDPFADHVFLDITGSSGRVRIPQALLPMIRGGRNGWMELRNVSVTPDEITASATINFLNRARIRISRITGIMSMNVLRGRFDGRCQAYDPATVQRAF
jgi:hypothetical protein